MREEKCFGVILVVEDKEEYKILLVKQKGDQRWTYPKGHPEKGELPLESALRELKEETGISSCDISDMPPVVEEYSFKDEKGILVNKTVEYFIAFARGREVVIQEEEITDHKWATFKEAVDLFRYPESIHTLEKAEEQLKVKYDKM